MRIVAFLFAIALLLGSCGQKSDEYTVTGEIEGVDEGTAVLQKLESSSGPEAVDTSEIVDGKFSFSGKVDQPMFYLVYVNDDQNPVTFFLENADVEINGNIDSLQAAEVKGSELNEKFQKFNDEVPSGDRAQALQEEFMQARQSGDQQLMEELSAEYQGIMEEQQQYFKDYVNQNTDNAVGAFLGMNMARSMNADELEELVASFEEEIPEHPYVKEMQDMVGPAQEQSEAGNAVQVGSEAPDFTLADAEGNEHSLSDFQGKYVFLDFWASWCSPCREENPNLVKVYKQYGGEDFEIVGVSLDKTRDPWLKAVEEDNITWTQLHDPEGEVAGTYGVQSIPFTLLLDEEGEIIEKNLRGDALQDKLDEIL
ncbi:MAG: redoxin domain-containing protein [Marinilabiliaceae bacterium]